MENQKPAHTETTVEPCKETAFYYHGHGYYHTAHLLIKHLQKNIASLCRSSTKASLWLSLHRLRRRSSPSEPRNKGSSPLTPFHWLSPTVYLPSVWLLLSKWKVRAWLIGLIDLNSLICFSCHSHSPSFTNRLTWSEAARRSTPHFH